MRRATHASPIEVLYEEEVADCELCTPTLISSLRQSWVEDIAFMVPTEA